VVLGGRDGAGEHLANRLAYLTLQCIPRSACGPIR
jgi:hypothetical protein